MAYYKSGLVSKNIDPIHHSKSRSEFHLDPNTMYVSNMRLLNIGVTTVGDEEVAYNMIGGAPSVIKNIYLYDGRQVLDQLTNHANWMAFVHYNKSNSESIELSNVLHRTTLGFVFDKESGIRPTDELPNIYPHLAQVKVLDNNAPNFVTKDEATTSQCFLNLTDVFPLLTNMPTIDTQLFQNFRIVIEYNSASICLATVDPAANPSIVATQPLLVVDEITNSQACMTIRSQFKGVVWKAIEVESVLLPSPIPSEILIGTQKRSWKFTGLTGKTLFRVLVQKSCSDIVLSNSLIYKSIGSEAMERETWQIAVNNQNLFPNSGITSTNEKLQLLTQTWGTCNAVTCGTGGNIISPANYSAQWPIILDSLLVTGHTDYFGCMVSQAVKSLSLSYSRGVSAAQDLYYITPLTFNVFAEVQKIITPTKGGGYTVSYL